MEVRVLLKNEKGEALAVTCKECGKFTLDTLDFLCASCTFDHMMRTFFVPPVRYIRQNDEQSHTTTKEDDHVSKS